MPKPGLYPRSSPRSTESHAERAVYDALARQLPKGWYAWHSVRIRVARQPDCEADFVIADPARGLLVVEVKGGQIEQRDGHWFSGSHRLHEAPRDQAHRFLRFLIERLHARDLNPPCGIATFFPDTAFSNPPGEGDLAGCVLGQQDLTWLAEALPKVMECALTHGARPTGRWVEAVHELWSETWVPRLSLGDAFSVRREELLRLDAQQFEILQGLDENRTVLVEGGAGTGKTILAHATARRLAERGEKVLLLCFTEALASWLAVEKAHPNLTVRPVKRFAIELLRQAGSEVVEEDTPEFWKEVTLRAAVEAMPPAASRWDAVVVDEGQDLIRNDWDLIRELAAGKRLWAFHDPEQAFWPDRRVPEDLFATRYRLQKPYRCPKEIQALAGAYLGKEVAPELLERARKAGVIAARACPSRSSIPEKIALEVDKMLADGLEPGEIAILSLRGAAEPDSIVHVGRLGAHRIVRGDDPDAGSEVVAETFLRFKGLERPGVIVTDNHLALEKPDYGRRMYIALTRALSCVRIVDCREDLARDPILVSLLQA